MRLILFLGFLGFFNNILGAKLPCDIKIEISNYSKDTLDLGFFGGGEIKTIGHLRRSSDGSFYIRESFQLEQGMYVVQMLPDKRYFEFIIDSDQEFTLKANYFKVYEDLSSSGSLENELFFKCLKLINTKRKDADELASKIKLFRNRDPRQAKEYRDKLELLNKLLIQEQLFSIKDHPNSLTYKYIMAASNPEPDEYDSTDSVQVKSAALYVRRNFLSNIDLNDIRIMHSPYPYNQIQTLISNNLYNRDTLNTVLKSIAAQILPNVNTRADYFNFILRLMSSPKPTELESGYVFLITEYVQKGKTPWIGKKDSLVLSENLARIEPMLNGNKAPFFSLQNQLGQTMSPYSLDSLITVLYFGETDCEPCKKAFPGLLDFYEIYKYKKVGVMAVCTSADKTGDKCFRFAEANLVKFPVLAAREQSTEILKLYNVSATPGLVVLDKNKNILAKNIGLQELYKVVNKALSSQN